MLIGLLVAALVVGKLLVRSDWVVEQPISAVRTGTFDSLVTESSGVAASARHPGLFWTILDSGNPAELIAVDSAGRVHRSVRLAGSTNVDWEAVAVGPCPAGTCVYVGDIGDNRARRASVTLYRIPEDSLDAAAAALDIKYPDGPRDAEAIIITPDGDVLIVSKGMAAPIKAYRVRAAAWGPGGTVTAQDLGPLPIDPRTALGRWVTGASLASDGRRVAIRTYRDIFFFELGANGRLSRSDPPALCDVAGLESQGEGIGWAGDSTLILTSEAPLAGTGSVYLVVCESSRRPVPTG